MATYSFTLRSGITLSDASVTYSGGVYNVKAALTAGSGTITTTNEQLAGELRGLLAPDGNPVLVEAGVTYGAVFNDLHHRPRRTFFAPAQPDELLVGDIWFKTNPTTGAVIDVLEAT